MKAIGIVAVTPKSGVDVFKYINTRAKDLDENQPRMFIESTPIDQYVKAFDQMASGNKSLIIEVLANSLEALGRAGSQIAIIPNNSSLSVFEEIQKKSPIMLVNMLDAIVEECQAQKLKKLAIFGPSPVIKGKVYQNPLEKVGLSIVIPSDIEQEFLQKEIMLATKGGVISENSLKEIHEIYAKLRNSENFDAVIIACSELTMILPPPNEDIRVLNPFNLLADEALKISSERP